MSEAFDIYTLLFLVLAVVIFIRLRGVLGRRTGNERPPYDPYTRTDAEQATAPEGTVVALPRGRTGRTAQDEAPGPSAEDIEERIERFPPRTARCENP
jgi:predicted lipid-binding transport protein (Tim44 family)